RLNTLIALAAMATDTEEPPLRITRIPARDWVSESLRGFPPLMVARYFVHGSHITSRPPVGLLPLMVDAGTAFGSGEHASTRGCLLALDRLARRRRRQALALDMGCGSGILALAIARTWHGSVQAADIDPVAVRVTTLNARLNGLAAHINAVASEGFTSKVVRRRGPYSLITANILARPLALLAPRMAHALAPGGIAILSGILVRQQRHVLNAYRTQGLVLERRIVDAPWITLVLKRRG
ncbi:MAG: 50S ribosomal protein L11 methyltransferase, partial [Alphaproteobacteria bacterium]|nr:50S ribosomal protein L11 methyltransferase [Alphaproteobacteria bacterium]